MPSDPSLDDPLPPPTLRVQNRGSEVYRRLKWEITRGVLPPNSPLVEVELAGRLKVSRTPVRESLQRLESEGLIVSRRRRWFVYEFSRGEVIEIYEVRAALEGLAARLASERASDEERTQLEGFRPHAARAAGLRTGRVELNDYFHDMIAGMAQNTRLKQLIEANRAVQFGIRLAPLYSQDELVASAEEHALIIDAICSGEHDLAESRARDHLARALGVVLRRLY